MRFFLRTAREQDLALQYAAAKAMLPYFPSGGGHYYSQYDTFYIHHLETLPQEMLKNLMNDCSLRVSEGIFNAIHTDQYIETTYMLLGHGPGGAKEIVINEKQMTVWVLNFATCGELVQNIMAMSKEGESQAVTKHKEESMKRIKAI